MDNPKANGVVRDAGYVHLNHGDLVYIYGDFVYESPHEKNVEGVNCEMVGHHRAGGGHNLAVYVVKEDGMADIHTVATADIVKTGGQDVVAIEEASLVAAGESEGKFAINLNPGDVLMSWTNNEDNWHYKWFLEYSNDTDYAQHHGNPSEVRMRQASSSGYMREYYEILSPNVEVGRTENVGPSGNELVAVKIDPIRIPTPDSLVTSFNRQEVELSWNCKTSEVTQYEVEQNGTVHDVEPVSSDTCHNEWYSYGNPVPVSANPPVDFLEARASHLLLLKHEGRFNRELTMVAIHGKPEDRPSGSLVGEAEWDITVPSETYWSVWDDPGDGPEVHKNWEWWKYRTAGGGLRGGLSTEFDIRIEPNFISGVDNWYFLDGVHDNKVGLETNYPLNVRGVEEQVDLSSEQEPDLFSIERKSSANPQFRQIGQVSGGTRSFVDRHVATGVEYVYRVRSMSEEGYESPASNEDSVDISGEQAQAI